MRRKNFFIVSVVVMGILFVSTGAFALGRPTIVYPKVAYGESDPCYTSRRPTFIWTAVEGATWYRIWVARKSSPNTAVIDQWVEGTSWVDYDRKLSAGDEYTWWVCAWNATEGAGPWSTGEDFTVGRIYVITINANAFEPAHYDYQYDRKFAGDGLIPEDGYATWGAPVFLPDGAVVTGITFYYYNEHAVTEANRSGFSLNRSRYDSIDTSQQMAHVDGVTSQGYQSSYTSTIAHSRIDNFYYSYFLTAHLPTSDNQLVHVKIFYRN